MTELIAWKKLQDYYKTIRIFLLVIYTFVGTYQESNVLLRKLLE